MFISREKFEQMEYELEQEKVDKEFWHMMSNDWKDTSTDYRSRYNSSEKFANKLIEEKGELEKENKQLKESNEILFSDYMCALAKNDLLESEFEARKTSDVAYKFSDLSLEEMREINRIELQKQGYMGVYYYVD